MMNAYAPAGWENFFVAVAGAAAALGGLMFVALSINLSRILELPGLSTRAAEIMILLAGNLVAALFVLIPGQGKLLLGSELLLSGLLMWGSCTRTLYLAIARRRHRTLVQLVIQISGGQLATLPVILSAVSLFLEKGGGLYWLVPAVVFSFAHALMTTWVLLVEILR